MFKVKIDSRKVTPGDTYVAVKGHTVDGHDYIEQAIEKGAVKIIATHGSYSVETVLVEDPMDYITKFLIEEYKDVLSDMKLIGMTGTNGKTTTCYLTYQMLNKLGIKCGYIGTIGYYLDDMVCELPNTTPNIVELYELIIGAYEKGYKTLVMEVSSHALSLGRVEGLNFFTGAFSNLTQDHLDYHKTMESYLEAKLTILDHMSGTFISNMDDECGIKFDRGNTLGIGYNANDYKLLSYENIPTGTLIKFSYEGKEYEIKNSLRGKFNVYNFLTCVAMCNRFVSLEEIINISESISAPRGRCQIIPVKNGEAVVDYAHTPDAVEKIIDAFTEHKTGKIITVVGCGGDRDPLKRPIMGRIASDKSDYCVFTSDNPRTEEPQPILDQVVDGAVKDNYIAVMDRREAIIKALDMIENDGDTVLILGKGHEDYQIIGHDKIHFDDVEEVLNYRDAI